MRPVRAALGPVAFARLTGVSRETMDRLVAYVELLAAWNQRINLIGRNTMSDVWRRHILDSAQLYKLLPIRARVLVDLGSGAGLPGLVLGAMGVPEVHLIESDQRKCAFLREAARLIGVPAQIHAQRIEDASPIAADAVTARALAPVDQLIELSKKFVTLRTVCLFLKGDSVAAELEAARAAGPLDAELLPSVSDPSGRIVRIEAPRG
jgi:16S rRNA (guanine527-N7)-methyltransferase